MSKKILSLFLAVVMLALAIPAAVLPTFAAEAKGSSSSAVITDTWTGSEEDATISTVPDRHQYFLEWFNGDTLMTGGDVNTATAAKVNPLLIEAGVFSADDTVETAFKNWVAYMKENDKIVYHGNWSLSGIDGTTMETILYRHHYNNRSIAHLQPGSKWITSSDGDYVVEAHINKVYSKLYDQLLSAGASAEGAIGDLALTYSSSGALNQSVRPQMWELGSKVSAANGVAGGIVTANGSTTYTTGVGGVAYTYTAPAVGYLKLSVDSISGAAEAQCAVLVNGTELLSYTPVNLSSNAAATLNAALGTLDIPVKKGDKVSLAVKNGGTVVATVTAELDTSRVPPETWTGSAENATISKVPEGHQYLFEWFDANGAQCGMDTGASGDTAKFNPALIAAGVFSADDTVETAFNKWVAYMKENDKIVYNGNWSLSGIDGTTVATILYRHHYNNRSVFHLQGGAQWISASDGDYVVEAHINKLYDKLYSQLLGFVSKDTKVRDVALVYSAAMNASVRPQMWELGSKVLAANGVAGGIVTQNGSTTYTTGVGGVAYTYTAPAAGYLKLSVGSITGAATAECAVLVNGTEVLPYTAIDLSSGDAAAAINAALGALDIEVKKGDQVSLAVKNGGTVVATVTAEISQFVDVTYVAEVDGVKFESLQEAINAAQTGETITLIDDVTVDADITVAAGKAVELDLAGFDITVSDGSLNLYIEGKLTINDSVGGGVSTFRNHYVQAGGELIVNGGILQNVATNTAGFAIYNEGTLAINGGEIRSVNATNYAISLRSGSSAVVEGGKIYGRGGIAVEGGVLTVNGGEISCTETVRSTSHALYIASGEVTVNGGTFHAKQAYNGFAVDASGGKLTINDGTFVGYHNGETLNNCIYLSDNSAVVEIKGGTFNYGIEKNAANATVAVSGGIFGQTVKQEFCAEGYIPKDNGDGTYGVEVNPAYGKVAIVDGVYYATLQEAIDAAQTGETITLIDDVDMGTTGLKIVGKAITLDLNGKTLSGACAGGEKSLIYVENGAKLTLMDSATDGKIVYVPATSNPDGYAVDVKGEFVLESGTVELAVTEEFPSWNITYAVNVRPNEWGTPYTGPIGFVMNGGKIVSADAAIRLASSSATAKTVVFEMNGGSVEAAYDAVFVQQSDAANYDTFNVTVTGGTITGRDVFRIYGMAPATAGQYYNFALNGGTMTRTGDKARDYLVGDILCANTGLGATVVANGNITASAAIAAANAATEGYKWVEENGVFTLAACVYVAEVDGTKYESLQEAIDAADGKTVVVLADVELAEGLVVAAGKNVTIDLNGKTISGVSTSAAASAVITNRGTLTIKDEVGGGKITAFAQNPDTDIECPAYANNTITNYGTLNLYGGTIENSTGDEARACFPIDNNSTVGDAIVNIYGGTVTGRGAIRQFANSTTYKNEVNVYGGTISGTSYAIWVQNPGSGDPKAALNIQDGTVDKVLLEASTSFDIAITGGTIKTVELWEATDTDRDPSGFISGGTFTSAFNASFCEEGFAPAKNADGTYGIGKLPNAEVVEIGSATVVPEKEYYIYDLINGGQMTNSTAPFDLQIIMQFLAKDSVEDAEANAFGNYTTDFFLSISGMEGDSIVADDCYLAGYYASFGTWVVIPLDGFVIENGVVYPVISSVGLDFKYTDICGSVQDFICGIYLSDEILAANPNLNVSLELGLSESFEAAQLANRVTVDQPYVYDVEEIGASYVAQVESADSIFIKNFATLQEAIDAAKAGDVIKLLGDVTLTEGLTVAAGKEFTLDLNGKTVSYTTDVRGEFLLTNNGNVTIDDSSDAKDGKLSFVYNGAPDTSYGTMNGTIQNLGTLTIKNGTVENASAKMSHANYAINTNAGATLIVEGGKILNLNGHAIRMVSFGTALNTVTVTGGYIAGTRAINVQIPGSASSTTAPAMALTITGGELEATEDTYVLAVYAFSNGQSAKNLTINIEGGIFNGNVAINGAATESMQANALAVTGGTFNGEYGVYSYADDAVAAPVISITGGTFATNYCEFYAIDDGFGFKENAEGAYNPVEGLYAAEINGVYYATLDAALRAAAAGNTVTILSDVTYEGYLFLNPGVKLDLNGYTVTATGLAAFGQDASVVDTGATKGLLAVPQDNLVMTNAIYPMLPVFTEEGTGYVFVVADAQLIVKTETDANDTVPDGGFVVKFKPYITGGGVTTPGMFQDGALDNGLVFKIYVHCINGGEIVETLDFQASEDLVAMVHTPNSGKMFKLTVNNAAGHFDQFQVEIVLESSTGVAYSEMSDAFEVTAPAAQ